MKENKSELDTQKRKMIGHNYNLYIENDKENEKPL